MAISRLQHMNNGIFLCDKNEDNLNITSNVVYRDVCQNLNKMLILYVYSLLYNIFHYLLPFYLFIFVTFNIHLWFQIDREI